jgi:hypothetical protein
MMVRSLFSLLSPLLLVGCALDPLDEPPPDEALLAGDIVEFDGLALEVPPPGHSAGLSVETEDGWMSLIIDHTGERVHLERTASNAVDPDGADAEVQRTSALSACTDGAYRLTNRRWRVGMSWMFNASTPSGVDPTRAEVLVRRAASNIVTGRNDCGRADGISATTAYRGRTTLAPGAARNHADETICISDLKSVVGFRSVGDGFKAATCWWANVDGELTEADISFHPSVAWTLADSIPSSCTTALHFESVATHEFGHAFGLNHPGSGHSTLTMQPGAACDNSKVTLGLGDLRGLEEIY